MRLLDALPVALDPLQEALYRLAPGVNSQGVQVDPGRITELLAANGFRRLWPELSRFDDWYVKDGPAARG